MVTQKGNVGGVQITDGSAEALSALSWWLESGVDVAVDDVARDWLKPAPPKPLAAPAELTPPPNVARPSAETLADLQQWLASSAQLPLSSATARRILPHGPKDAAIMLLSDAPALEDFTDGRPIGGEAWQLASRMLAAIGIDAEAAYSASLSCFHAPGTRMSEADRQACAEIAREHIRLVQPKLLLLLGDGPARAMIGKPLASARGHVHKIEGVRTVATFHPRQLLGRPADKALAWRDLLLLIEDRQ